MEQKTTGTVISVARQWWCKVNTKAVRAHALDGATFPHIIKFTYTVDGATYTRRKWFSAGAVCPAVGQTVTVSYPENKPAKGRMC